MFKFFKKNKKEPKDIKEVLGYLNKIEQSLNSLSQDLEEFKKESKFFVQKVGMVRYNPFSGVGGDQSFSLALLDGNDDGLVITSIYGRGGNRIFAKSVERGISKHQLSSEEKEAISRAIGP